MKNVTVSIAPDGTYRFLLDESTKVLLTPEAEVKRASHVEPVDPTLRKIFHALRNRFGEYGWMASFTRSWRCRWRINLSPIGRGVLYQTYTNRQAAIDAEVEYLHVNYI